MLPLPGKVYVVGGLIVALGAGYGLWSAHLKAVGARDERIKGLVVENGTLKTVITADSLRLAKRDTVRLFAKIDTGHTIIQTLIDTAHVYHTDTVKITVEKLVTIDSTIRVCRETVSECAKLANDRGRRIAVLDSTVAALMKNRPGILSRCGAGAGYGVTLAGGKVQAGPTVTIGCRLLP